MAKEDKTPRTNPAEIENLIEQIRGTNLDPRAKEKVERLLRTVLTLVELLQRKNTSIKKLCPCGNAAWRIWFSRLPRRRKDRKKPLRKKGH